MNPSLQLFDVFLSSGGTTPVEPPVDGLAISFVLLLFAVLVLLTQFAPTILEFINTRESRLGKNFWIFPRLCVPFLRVWLLPMS
jgi:hypothetical protein